MGNELRKYGVILWHWAWLIVLGTLLGGGLAFAYSRLTTPVYAASTTLLVSEAPSSGKTTDYTSILTSERLASTYAQMMTKQPVLDSALKSLNLDIPVDKLPARISVNPVRDTQLLVLQIESEDPVLAMNLAHAIPDAFSRQNAAAQTARYSDSKTNLSKEIDSLKEQITQKQTEINALGTPSSGSPKEAEVARLQTELMQLRQSLTYLLQSYESIRLTEAQSTSNIVVVEAPTDVPNVPVRPRTLLNTLLGASLGLILSLVIVFLIEHFDDHVRLPDQVGKALKLPIIGLIPKMSDNHEADQSRLIAVREPRSPVVEAFRSLRTNIQFSGVDQPIRTLLITSPGPSAGKSTVASNLAVVMAQAGLKVVLLDGDLRRPTIHKQFNQVNRNGFTDAIMRDPSQWNNLTVASGVPNLTLLLSGTLPPNPSELLGSKRMRQLLEYLHQSSDLVIVDAPPLLPVTDALVVAPAADGVILVLDYGGTRISEAVSGKTQLDQSSARILGVVLNKIPIGRRGYSYYYAHYYSDEGESKPKRRQLRGRKRSSSEGAGGPVVTLDSKPGPSSK